ncbi:MAG TPA: helicase-exonuclease AddAB subunit AddA [Syntrophomonadaceae bacterium]|nr:helicase-exonuclease AddAB subunit AddA [Syntrophomonadaceae bacterium]HQD90314.1 helicase-exonuclease AddAB subunit AddA [Syntrophomonadaceae bacterium]
MPQWTSQQRQAIEAKGSNLLVSASAGSGKTAVLVQRIIHIIVDQKVDIDRLLVVTFTQAAAAEMRERISTALMELIEQGGYDSHLRKQLLLINHAQISTIHSFCNEVVRNYFHLIDIDPRYRIADQTEAGLIKMEVLQELMEEQYEQSDPGFLELVEMFSSSRDDAQLRDLILQIYDFIQSQPDPLNWLWDKIQMFTGNNDLFTKSNWATEARRLILQQLQAAEQLVEAAWAKSNLPYGSKRYLEALEIDLQQIGELHEILMNSDLSNFYDVLTNLAAPRLKPAEKDADPDLCEEVKELRKEARDIIKQISSELLPRHPEQLLQEINQLHPVMLALYQLIEKFADQYYQRKMEKSLLDFNDLEHCALSILRYPEAAQYYRERFEYIFVDEYQDSNQVQETLLNQIKRPDNLFMVGDVKQSIYRFRSSDPGLFIEKYRNFKVNSDSIDRRINLDRNFRCSRPIVDAVNCIFSHIMSEQLGEVEYDEEVKLVHATQERPLSQAAVEVLIVDRDAEADPNDAEDLLEEADQIEIEARLIAERIKELVSQQVYDPQLDQFRLINYRDIVVLMRATSKWVGVFQEVFLAENIPCYADVNSGYFETVEIGIFLDLLRLIDNKRQDIPLVGVMRSPVFNFTVEDLIEIRSCRTEGSFYEAVEEYIRHHDNQLGNRLEKMLEQLNEWKKEARFLPMDAFIWKVMLETGFYHYVGAMPGGTQRQANLRILHDRARQFQNTSFKGLFQFLQFLDQVRASSGDMDMAKTLGENDNVVRLMSIHKSKGLEFPIVIVAGMGRQFNLRDLTHPLLMHKDLGLGPRFVNLELRATMDTLPRNIIQQKIRWENLSEEMRILYVACTRPKNKLILVGSVKNIDRAVKRWARPLSAHQLAQARCFLDWIGPVIIRHPEGVPLRELLTTDWEEPILQDSCLWQVEVLNRFHLSKNLIRKRQRTIHVEQLWSAATEMAASNDEDLVISILDWIYPFKDSETLPSKLFVTQIREEYGPDRKRLTIQIPEIISQPDFIQPAKRLNALQRGTAMHKVMQHLDLSNMDGSLRSIVNLVETLVEREIISPLEAETVDLEAIQIFINSALGQRIKKASHVYREAPFNLLCPANEVLNGENTSYETLLVQGVIDLYFEENDGLILVDYKTDRLTHFNLEQRLEHYRKQLYWYRRALEQIQKKPVREMYLYFFDNRELLQLQ